MIKNKKRMELEQMELNNNINNNSKEEFYNKCIEMYNFNKWPQK